MSNFDRLFDLVVSSEGGFSDYPADPGNWTGGKPGAGVCRGTKFGISAAAYPDVDIASLTLDQAKALYRRDYWDQIAGDELPPGLALLAFDSAVNNGCGRAKRWLQEVARVDRDGVIGPQTLDAIHLLVERPGGITDLCAEFMAQRLMFMTALPTWKTFGLGWARRLCRLPYEALAITS